MMFDVDCMRDFHLTTVLFYGSSTGSTRRMTQMQCYSFLMNLRKEAFHQINQCIGPWSEGFARQGWLILHKGTSPNARQGFRSRLSCVLAYAQLTAGKLVERDGEEATVRDAPDFKLHAYFLWGREGDTEHVLDSCRLERPDWEERVNLMHQARLNSSKPVDENDRGTCSYFKAELSNAMRARELYTCRSFMDHTHMFHYWIFHPVRIKHTLVIHDISVSLFV